MSVKPMIQFKKEFNLRKFFRGTKIFLKWNSYCTVLTIGKWKAEKVKLVLDP